MFTACFDVETFLIEKGRLVPPFVVLGWTTKDDATGESRQGGITHRDETWGDDVGVIDGGAPTVASTVRWLFNEVRRRDGLFINQNVPFDFAVMAEFFRERGTYPDFLDDVFRLYDEKRVRDTMLNEQLMDVAEGCLGLDFSKVTAKGNPSKKYYSLAALAKNYLKFDMDKTTWRTGYDKLYNVPLAEWPEGAKDYVILDTEVVLDVFRQQLLRAGADHIPDSENQPRFAWALHLMSAWGIRTDGAAASVFKAELEARLKVLSVDLVEHGFMRAEGSRDMAKIKKAIEDAYVVVGKEAPKTDKDNTITDADTIRDVVELLPDKSEYKILRKLSDHQSTQKLLTTYVPVLEEGARVPINAKYTCILETGRTSCSSPNLQNLPRGDDRSELGKLSKRVRECFIPRPGYVFCSCDYNALELRTLAQTCYEVVGHSSLGDSLNEGKDPYLVFAAERLLGVSYEEAWERHLSKDKEVKFKRQVAKAVILGAPGGFGVDSLVDYLKSYGVIATKSEAKVYMNAWHAQYPEMRPYFGHIKSIVGSDGNGVVVGPTGFVGGGKSYTQGCNFFFQHRASILAKEANYRISKACLTPGNVLYGSRLVVFVHDETILEHPIESAHERAYEQARIMGDTLLEYCPRLLRKDPEPALMTRWIKEAEAKFDESGRLVPWE